MYRYRKGDKLEGTRDDGIHVKGEVINITFFNHEVQYAVQPSVGHMLYLPHSKAIRIDNIAEPEDK